jgi:protein ImuB
MTPSSRQIKAATSTAKTNQSEKSVLAIIALLHKWGIHTFGEFSRLDKEDIRTRLGREAVWLWERAQGKAMRLLNLVEPPESFIESFEFEYEIETAEPLLFVLRRFLEQLAFRLTGIHLVAKALTLHIHFGNKTTYERRFEIPQPTNAVELLFRMLQTHLEDFKSDHPIVAVSLEAQPTKPLPQQFGLFEASLRNPNQLYETLARLAALLGNDRVGTPVLEDTYRPDAFRIEPFSWELPESLPLTQAPTGAALRKFRPNRSIAVSLKAGDPVHLHGSEVKSAVAEKAGPYMASGNWWDEKTWSRQEWDAQLQNGVVCRIHANGEGWQLDGIYD